MSTTTTDSVEDAVTILARVLDNEQGPLSPEAARYLLDLKFSDRDKARMHDLAVRNQEGRLTSVEFEEMMAFGRAGDILAIFKSRARQALGIKATRPTTT